MAYLGKLTSEKVMEGMSIRVRVSSEFKLRTRIATWLIGLAGRVLTVPVEVELRRDASAVPGAGDAGRLVDMITIPLAPEEMTPVEPGQRQIAVVNSSIYLGFWSDRGYRVWQRFKMIAPDGCPSLDGHDAEFIEVEPKADNGVSFVGKRGPELEATPHAAKAAR